jgi:D-aminopeptidase
MARQRARETGVRLGRMPTGLRNAITDVEGVRVGHEDVRRDGDGAGRGVVCTGVTTIFPTTDPCHEWVYVGTDVLNGYGEMVGINQLNEWGVLHSPIVLTSSLSIGLAYDATAKWMVRQDPRGGGGMPVVTECDDSFLNDATAFPLSEEAVWAALDGAREGDVEEGCVGAGSGMQCFDFKGGIGTASRSLPPESGGFRVGALVMTNFGRREDLRIDGVPVGQEIVDMLPEGQTEGSCIVVLATDAPLLPHQLRRLAKRGGLGLARTGSNGGNGSGELMLAFSTAQTIRAGCPESVSKVDAAVDGYGPGSIFSALFTAAVEATEEAVVNSLFMATTTTGREGHTLHALPIDRTLATLERAGRLAKT